MRDGSHKTVIGILRDAIEAWRKRERWSQMAVVQCIVEEHERLGLDAVAEIHFERAAAGRDAYRCMQTNAERVYRWLDDQSKPNNLLPSNFIQSVLAALPVDLRIDAVNQMVVCIGLVAHALDINATSFNVTRILQAVAREGGEATASLADLLDGASEAELLVAQQQLAESVGIQTEALRHVEAMLMPEKK